jgi:hypothetical protein
MVSSVYAGAGCDAAAKATLAKVMEGLPAMKFKVGDAELQCPTAAAAKAEETKSSITYVVGDKTYADRKEADAKLAELVDAEVAKLASVQYVAAGQCYSSPKTAAKAAEDKGEKLVYQVAGFSFDSQEKADKAAKVVAEAVAKLAKGEGKPAAPAVAEGEKPGCGGKCGDKAKTASADGAKPGCGGSCAGHAKTASAEGGKQGGCAGEAKTASANPCALKTSCPDAGKDNCRLTPRLVSAYEKLQVIVSAAATVAAS